MSFEDQLHISTPEGVDLELTRAGLGSRIAAGALDQAIKLSVIALLFFLYFALSSLISGVASAIAAGVLVIFVFVFNIGYDVLFEVLGSGRTLGKRALGTRVIRADGSPVDFRSSVIRNLIRIVDAQPPGIVIGVLLILFTPRDQRLGDIAAGTVVVRERQPALPATAVDYIFSSGELRPWDVGAVDRDVVATLRNFLARRATLAPAARNRIATGLYERIRPMVGGVAEEMIPEAFLEEVVRLKSSQ